MSDGTSGTLLEVAVTLPLSEMYTYRDPRPGVRVPVGTQVVVPFGPRRITGFVVGYAAHAPATLRDIEAVLGEEPVIDPDVLELCRFIAAYYVAPLGEVLRAALPQGERAAAARKVWLSEDGRRMLAREASAGVSFRTFAFDEQDRALLQRLAKTRAVSLRSFEDEAARRRVERLAADGLLEIGDEVEGRTERRKDWVAFAVPGGPAIPARAAARVALFEKISAAGGVSVKTLSTAERSVLRLLVAAGAVRLEEAHGGTAGGEAPPPLNGPQAEALEALVAGLSSGGFSPFLLQGITGSGKTEVYLRLIAEARRAGKGAVVLVPEIALTPQLAARFRARFGDDVAVLHSGLPASERRAAWQRLREGQVGIALGARSAVFAPVRNLGVVVVDEEHDSSFKQDDGVRYNGRDMAVVRAQRANAVAVLGSATPSLETYRNFETGRFRRLLLPVRANPAAAARPLPPIDVVDLKRHPPMADGLFSRPLFDAVAASLAAREQTILFLNRRGFAPLVLCRACGHVVRCDDCAVSMTYHRASHKLVCHYCAASVGLPRACPSCRAPRLEQMGIGTERVESIVRGMFPEARVARLDRDTAGTGRGAAFEKVLAAVHAGEIDILVGTQMVTKGHDFPGVTLVGVLLPDQGMHMPDFRAAERTFQLLEQVAGRAGRADKAGRVVVQTYCPEHAAIRSLATHDYEGFVRAELEQRRQADYPPYRRMVVLRLDGPTDAIVRAAATAVAARAQKNARGVRVLGPAEAPIPMLRKRVRWQVWLSGPDRAVLAAVARDAMGVALPDDVRLSVDVDPQSVL